MGSNAEIEGHTDRHAEIEGHTDMYPKKIDNSEVFLTCSKSEEFKNISQVFKYGLRNIYLLACLL